MAWSVLIPVRFCRALVITHLFTAGRLPIPRAALIIDERDDGYLPDECMCEMFPPSRGSCRKLCKGTSLSRGGSELRFCGMLCTHS